MDQRPPYASWCSGSSTYTAISYMVDLGDKEFYKLAVGAALSADTVEWARALIDTMTLADAEDTAFFALHDLAISLREDSLSWFEMDSMRLETVMDLASDSTEMKGYAEAIIALLSDSTLTRIPEQMIEFSGRMGQEDDEQPTEYERSLAGPSISVFPNPFQNSFTIEFALEQSSRELIFEIFDLAGRRVQYSLIQNSAEGRVEMALNPCVGLYFLRVSNEGKTIENRKLICLER